MLRVLAFLTLTVLFLSAPALSKEKADQPELGLWHGIPVPSDSEAAKLAKGLNESYNRFDLERTWRADNGGGTQGRTSHGFMSMRIVQRDSGELYLTMQLWGGGLGYSNLVEAILLTEEGFRSTLDLSSLATTKAVVPDLVNTGNGIYTSGVSSSVAGILDSDGFDESQIADRIDMNLDDLWILVSTKRLSLQVRDADGHTDGAYAIGKNLKSVRNLLRYYAWLKTKRERVEESSSASKPDQAPPDRG